MKEKDQRYLLNILNDLFYLLKITQNVRQKQLQKNPMLLDSILFRFVQISENISRLSPEIKSNHPSIPWQQMIGMRNRIVHDYGQVDITVVYDTVTRDVPNLYHQILEIKVSS